MRPTSVIASKNTRKRKEDRHVVLHDLKAYLPSNLQSKVGSEEHLSYYSVFDGHAGTDAACYAASHLHELLVASQYYPEDPVQAFTDAFLTCDKDFTMSSKKSGTTAVCALIRDDTIYIAWLGDSTATLVREGVTVKVMDSHKPDRPDERARVEALGGTVIHWGAWRVKGQLAVSRAIGDGDYKPLVTAQPDITTIKRNGTEDFLIVACDGLWDTITPEEATRLVFQHLKEHQTDGGDLENLAAKLATIAKEKGSTDNITIIVVLLKPVKELICPPLVPEEAEGRDAPHTHGITSTSNYVFANGDAGSGRSSTEPNQDDPSPAQSPSIKFDGSSDATDGSNGGVFSPATFGLGNGFDLSGEQFDTRPEDIRFSNGGEERISGVEKLPNGDVEEELKRQSIDKVDDLLAMLDREGGDSPSPEDDVEGGLSIDEVLARARERGDGEECGLEEEEEESGDSSEEEDIITDFPITNGGNSNLAEVLNLEDNRIIDYEEGRRQPCEQVLVVATGPEECGMVVPPAKELPSQQTPEVMSVMSCSMVAEEPLNGGEDYDGDEQEPHAKQEEEAATEEVVTFGEADEQEEQVTGFMLKTPGQLEQQLVSFEPESNVDPGEEVQQQPEERETSVDTGEEVQGNENKDKADEIPIVITEEMSSLSIEKGAEIPVDLNPNGTVNMEPPSLMVTPATPSRRLSDVPGPSEASSTTTEEVNNEAGANKTEIVQPESKPEVGVKKSSEISASATSNAKTANGKTKSSDAKPARPSAKETGGTGMASKGMASTKSTKTTASAGAKTTVGKVDPTKATGTAKPTTLSKAPASGGARPKVGATSALKGDQKEAKLNDKKPALSKPASKPPDAARPGKAPSSVSPSGARTRAPPSTAAEIAKKTSAKPTASTSPAKTSSTISEGKGRTVPSTRPTTRPTSSTTGALSKPAPPSARAATRPTSSTAPRSTGSSTASRAGSAASSSASTTSSLRRTPASQGPSSPRAPVKPATEGSKSGAGAKAPSASRPRLASTTKPKTSTTTVTSTMAGGGRATTTTTSSSRGAASTIPTSSTADRSAASARSPVKPSAAASRVAAARAAAKAAKPPPVRKPSASPVRKVSAAQDVKSEVMEAAGGQKIPEVDVAITENGAPAQVKEEEDNIMEPFTVKEQEPQEDGRQNGEETSVGQVTVNGEQEDIGTSEC